MENIDLEAQLPLIGILRGVRPSEVIAVAQVLFDAGFSIVEVPLNSPDAISSIQLLVERYGKDYLIGAGTVTNAEQAQQVIDAGAKLIVTPNFNADVVKRAKAAGIVVFSGVVTPTEAFNALASGASGLKLFPANMVSIEGFKAMKSVLPSETLFFPVGGIEAVESSMQPWLVAGASGFGLGSALYRPEMSLAQIKHKAEQFVQVYQRLTE